MKTRKIFLLLAILILLNRLVSAENYSFVVLGDNRPGRDIIEQPAIFKKIIDKINRLKPQPDFVISIGDIIWGYTRDNELLEKEFNAFEQAISKLKVPFYNAPGNHEISSRYAVILYKKLFSYLPGEKLYYSFNHKGSHFIALNTEEYRKKSQICCKQLDWLKEDLEKNKTARHIFVFFHRPLYPVANHIGDSLDKYPEKRDALVKLFNKYKVKYVFCGHEHLYSKSNNNGLIQIITGGAGASLYDSEQGGFHHFILVNVKNKKVFTKVVRVENN